MFSVCLLCLRCILSAKRSLRSPVHASNILMLLVLNSQVGVTFAARWSNSAVDFVDGCRCPFASSYIIFDLDRRILKAKFLKNGFPSVLFDLTVGKFLDKLYTTEEIVATVKRMRVTMVLPYLVHLSVFIRRHLIKLLTKFYPLVDLKIIYKRGRTIGSMFPYKDNFPLKCNSSVVYKIECESCGSSATYVGKTINTIHETFYGANGHLHPSTKSTALLDHQAANVTPTCEFNTNNIKILDACTGDLKLRFAESIHLKHSKQTLNTQERSIPLKII